MSGTVGLGEARGRTWVSDLIAGLSVGLVLIPQSMAYSELAGLPAHYGLYAAALPPIAAALFASSPYLQTGPVALTSLLTLGALLPLAAVGTTEYVQLAALLAVVVGVARMLVGAVKVGWVAYLMSQPVLQGFTAGAAVLILSSQLPGAAGVGNVAGGGGVLSSAWWTLTHPGAWEVASVVISVVTYALISGARRISPLVPGVLVATLGALAFSVLSGYAGPTIGEIPAGLPSLTLSLPWSALPVLLVPGVVIALVGFAEAASISRTFAAQDRTVWDPDKEFLGQGLANLASGLSGGFPVGGSFSRSSINRLAGARTRLSGAVTGALVLAFLPFAGILAPLPRATLSAIVIAAVLKLVKVMGLLKMWRLSKPQTVIGVGTFVLTLALAPRVDQAILIGILASLAVHGWREMTPRVESWVEDGVLHVRPHGVLWFGSAPVLENDLLSRLVEGEGPQEVHLHLRGLGRIDLTGALGLRKLMEDADLAGVHLTLVEVPPHAERILGRVLGWKRGDEDAAAGHTGSAAPGERRPGPEGDDDPDASG